MLTEPRDMERLVEGLQVALELASSPSFTASYRGIGLLDPASSGDRDALEVYIRSTVGGWFHACGTCQMGSDPDEGAVVDGNLQVHGVDGLARRRCVRHADRAQSTHQPQHHCHRGTCR